MELLLCEMHTEYCGMIQALMTWIIIAENVNMNLKWFKKPNPVKIGGKVDNDGVRTVYSKGLLVICVRCPWAGGHWNIFKTDRVTMSISPEQRYR